MQNLWNVALLLSAIFTCLAVGVGAAYGLCNLLFAGMKVRGAARVPSTVVAKVIDAAPL